MFLAVRRKWVRNEEADRLSRYYGYVGRPCSEDFRGKQGLSLRRSGEVVHACHPTPATGAPEQETRYAGDAVGGGGDGARGRRGGARAAQRPGAGGAAAGGRA